MADKEAMQGFTLLFHYLKDARYRLIVCFGSLFVSLVVFWLYGIPNEVILYTLLLCFSLWFIYFSVDFSMYLKRWQRRQRLMEEPEYNLWEMTEPVSLEEKEYQELLGNMIFRYKDQISELEQKQQEQSDYIMLWAHQMKTPITAMSLLLQSGGSDQVTDLQEELFEIEGYVDALLQYVRLDSMNADFYLSECQLAEAVKTVIRYYSKTFIAKKLFIHLDSLERNVKTDEKWLIFVLKQIVSNALKYTKEGGITIYGKVMEQGEGTELVIEDTGCGIAKEDLPRIFEKAFTGYNGHRDRKATGIGLFLTKRIFDKLGHAICITSEEGEGTRVSIYFGDWKEQELAD